MDGQPRAGEPFPHPVAGRRLRRRARPTWTARSPVFSRGTLASAFSTQGGPGARNTGARVAVDGAARGVSAIAGACAWPAPHPARHRPWPGGPHRRPAVGSVSLRFRPTLHPPPDGARDRRDGAPCAAEYVAPITRQRMASSGSWKTETPHERAAEESSWRAAPRAGSALTHRARRPGGPPRATACAGGRTRRACRRHVVPVRHGTRSCRSRHRGPRPRGARITAAAARRR